MSSVPALKKGELLVIADFGKPKGIFGKLFGKFIVHFEHGKESYKGKIPIYVKNAGFELVKVERISRGVDIITAIK